MAITNEISDFEGLNRSIYADSLPSLPIPEDIIDDNEGVALALVSQEGILKEVGDQSHRIDLPVGMVVTDRRLLFAALEGEGSDAGELQYGEVANIGLDSETLVITGTDGVTWQFPLVNPDHERVDIAVRHLLWIGRVRRRIVSLSNDVELTTGKIAELSDDLEWKEALATYRYTRWQLDVVISLVQATTVIRDTVLAPELTEIDRQLEMAVARSLIDRAHSQLDVARQLVEYESFGQARTLFQDAHEFYRRAEGHSEEVTRSDAFQFGKQRELTRSLEELGWEIESAAAEPLQQANEAKVTAEDADNLTEEIDHMESAFRKYQGVLELEWSDDRQFTGDPESARHELTETVTRLIELHERAARSFWNEGSSLEGEGDTSSALKTCRTALEHLERAHELAEEFDRPQAGNFETQLKNMFELYLDMREQTDERSEAIDSAEADSGVGSGSEAPSESEEPASLSDIPETGTRPRKPAPSLEDLAEMDTHHEITLDLEGGDDTPTLSEELAEPEAIETTREDVKKSTAGDDETTDAGDPAEAKVDAGEGTAGTDDDLFDVDDTTE